MMKRFILFIGLLLLISAASATTYYDHYPSAYTAIYIKTNSSFAGNILTVPDPTTSLIGVYPWLGNAETNRINLDLGAAHVITHVYYENHHNSGGETTRGVKNFTIWGSNSASSFSNVNTTENTGWTELIPDIVSMTAHVASNTADPQFFNITNTNSYRYYSVKFTNSWGGGYTTLRRLTLQTADNNGMYDPTLLSVMHFNYTLGNPVNFTDDNGILWTLAASAGHLPYINTTSPKFGNGSVWFYGATDASTVSVINDTQRVWGTSNHTMEFQYFPVSTGTSQALIYQNNVFQLLYNGTAKNLKVYVGNGWNLTNGETSTSDAIPLNQWSHIEIDYAYPSFKIYVNGMLNYSKTLGGTIPTSTTTFSIGYTSGNNLYGGIDEFAEWSSTRHMANFTPPSTEYLMPIPLAASFTQSPNPSVIDQSVQFNDTSTGSPVTWNWIFGDGNVSTLQNPTNVFPAIGNYTVLFNVTNSAGAWSNTSANHTVSNATTPLTMFTADRTVIIFPRSIQFNDTSLNTPTAWNWTFGDGKYSDLQNATYQYVKRGRWTVLLNASNAAGYSTNTSMVWILGG
jgi:PKD repeat protein